MPAKTTLDRVVFEPIGFVSNSFNEPGDPKALRNSQSLLILDDKYIGAMDGLEWICLPWDGPAPYILPSDEIGI